MGFFKFGGFPTKHYSSATMEDLSAWEAEVDGANRLTTYGTSLFHIDSLDRDEDMYRFKDGGAGAYASASGWTHQFQFNAESTTDGAGVAVWAAADANDDLKDIEDGSGDCLYLFSYDSGGTHYVNLYEVNGGAETTGTALALSKDTIYYVTVDVQTSVGTYGTLRARVWSTSDRETTLVGTVTNALAKDHSLQYAGIASYNDGGTGEAWTGYVANYTLTSGNPQIVVDPGFDKTEEGADIVTNGDNEAAAASVGDYDVGYQSTTAQSAAQAHGGSNSTIVTKNVAGTGSFYAGYGDTALAPKGSCFYVSVWVYLPSGQTAGTILLRDGPINTMDSTTTTDAWVQLTGYSNASAVGRVVDIRAVGDNGEIFYLDDLIIQPVTFTHWDDSGVGWAPEANSGALTGKAVKAAGTASSLTQDPLTSRRSYTAQYTITRTAGTLAVNDGSDVKSYGAGGTYTINRHLATSTTLSFTGDASFAGTVDAIDVRPK